MTPALAPGDRLLVGYRRRPVPGDVVLARFPDGTLVVKRVDAARPTASGAPGWWLVSDNPDEGVDSRHRGALPDDDVLGVVLARVWPRPGRIRPL
jgi:phage repressor protein C with HTH and peptisase S24 domain